MKVYAFYLPQYHPIPENDQWYGKGYTEWTNVARSKPLFPGHYQPHIPADLGFYDLRLIDTIKNQALMAREYGVDGFCFWHYWFGDGKQLLEKPFEMLVNDKSINIEFSLAWANHTWLMKQWDYKTKTSGSRVICEQKYPGKEDIDNHFYTMLPAFKDERYSRVDGKLLFTIFDADAYDMSEFMERWHYLAKKEGVGDFYFVAHDYWLRNKTKYITQGFDAVYDDNLLNVHHQFSFVQKAIGVVQRNIFRFPTVIKYKRAMRYMIIEGDEKDDVIPMIAPNWDHSPRTGRKAFVLSDAEPKYFAQLLRNAIECNCNKPIEKQIIFIRAWNEWGEGNHLEPDLKYGKGYLEAIKSEVGRN